MFRTAGSLPISVIDRQPNTKTGATASQGVQSSPIYLEMQCRPNYSLGSWLPTDPLLRPSAKITFSVGNINHLRAFD
jgi:hypothetical protein